MKLSVLLKKLMDKGVEIKCALKDDFEVKSLLPLELSDQNSISYLDLDKYTQYLSSTRAGAVIVRPEMEKMVRQNAVITDNPKLVMAHVSAFFEEPLCSGGSTSRDAYNANIMEGVFIGKDVGIGDGSVIMPNVVICDGVSIGNNVMIMPNVTIYSNTKIGSNVRIQAGAVIGSDGYGYAHNKSGEHIKIIHKGGVIIEDDVEIGANVTISRAVFENTIIKKGAKIDNLVQIGHNCVVGERSLIVAQVGIAGSTKVGKNVMIGGQTGIAGHIEIQDFVQIGGKSSVTKNLVKGKQYKGEPIMEIKKWQRHQIRLKKLTDEK